MKFELMHQDWYKRRVPQYKEPAVVKFRVIGFKEVSGHVCKMFVKFDNGDRYILTARVHMNESYEMINKREYKVIPGHCSVQGTNPHGISVLLKLMPCVPARVF